VYHVGCQHFVGWQALDYVRQRELIPDGDYGRQRNQQQLIRALAAKVTASHLLSNPLAADPSGLGRPVAAHPSGTTAAIAARGRCVTSSHRRRRSTSRKPARANRSENSSTGQR
jgi:LytR_cpsA_psr family